MYKFVFLLLIYMHILLELQYFAFLFFIKNIHYSYMSSCPIWLTIFMSTKSMCRRLAMLALGIRWIKTSSVSNCSKNNTRNPLACVTMWVPIIWARRISSRRCSMTYLRALVRVHISIVLYYSPHTGFKSDRLNMFAGS